jgi:outer membrane protein W
MKYFFSLLFTINSLSISYAQIQKGAYQIGGEVLTKNTLFHENNGVFYTELSNPPNIWTTAMSAYRVKKEIIAMPSFQYYLTERLSIGGSIGLEKTTYFDQFSNKKAIIRKLFAFSPEVTYFFNPKAKWKCYANGSYLLSYSKNINNNKPSLNFNSLTNGFGLNIGVNRFLNENIALNTSLYYTFDDVENNQRGSSTSVRSGLNISLQNFIAQSLNQQFEESLLHRNRMTIGSALRLDLQGKNMELLLNYGYFPLKNLLVGINTYSNLYFGALRNYNQYSEITPYIQYYIPFAKKTAVIANVATPITFLTQYNREVVVVPAIGINQFLSKYVAIELLGKYQPARNRHFLDDGKYFGVETNIRYFLK